MSAWWTSKRHIDKIVTAAIGLGLISESEATATGKMLRAENAKSLLTRYSDDPEMYASDVDGYVFRADPDENLPAVHLALHSYDYQSCESDDYMDSEAARFVERWTEAITKKLGTTNEAIMELAEPRHGDEGYWRINEWPDLLVSEAS